MPIPEKYYPKIADLLPLDLIPDVLKNVEEGIQNILNDVYYTNYQVSKSDYNSNCGYDLTLIVFGQAGIKIPGTDLKLILNPDIAATGAQTSSFNISLQYNWPILRYINEFQSSQFSGSPIAFFELALDFLEIDADDFLAELIAALFNGNDPINDFVTEFNALNVQNPLTLISSDDKSIIIDLIDQLLEIPNIEIFSKLYEDFLSIGSVDEILDRLGELFKKWLGKIDADRFKELLTPSFAITINEISLGVQFSSKTFRRVDPITLLPLLDGNDEDIPSILRFNVGKLGYVSDSGFTFEAESSFDFPTSEILRSGFYVNINNLKVDLSKTKNIPEAIADGRPSDFIGVYATEATVGFPAFWKHDDGNSTGLITARNLLVGTGGISGTLGMEAKTNGNPSPLIKAKFGSGFEISLDAFALEFQQNAIISSDISGTMKIPKFKDANGNDAQLDIDVHIGQDGEFKVTVKEDDGIELSIPNVVKFLIKSASVGRQDDRFFLSVSGSVDFNNGNAVLSTLLPTPIQFQEIIIWDDGQFEIKGGGLELPQALTLKYPPVELSVTAIHLGSTERDYDDNGTLVPNRKYKYLGLDGVVKVDPGGVEARGKGIQVYFATGDGHPLDVFVRIESIAIDIKIPGDADPKDAALIMKGFLAMKDPPPGIEGTEYAGGISFDLPKAKIGGSAAMRFNPKVPYFIVDVEVELSKAIPLGSTGLGLYGFRGLIGKHFVASKAAAGVTEEEPWWKYYKAKIAPDNKEGVQISKFEPTGGFALGFGVSLATKDDGGKAFSSKIFFLLSLRELFMFQGQAAIMAERITLNNPNDPPFFALIVITKNSVEAALGVNYLVPDDKDPGKIATVQGVLELGFFFQDASAWYLNIGRDLPESYRIQVRLLDLFDAYFYFMLSGKGIRAGAGASFEVDKKFGPLAAHLWAYLDVAGKIAYKPKQIGGSIQLGGGVDLSIFGLTFGISAAASLAAESPEPFIVTGMVEVCIKVMGKDRCAKFEFEWLRNENIDTTEVGVITRAELGGAAQALNIQTQEAFPLNFIPESSSVTVYHGANNPAAGTWKPPAPDSTEWNGSFEDYIIPLDCFIDIEFKNGINPNGGASTAKFGKFGGANSLQMVPPQKGKTPQVNHNFIAEDIFIYAWDPDAGAWEEYDIYGAMPPSSDIPNMPPIAGLNLKSGYWQSEKPNTYNKLRILSQNPLSYVTQTSGEFIPENSGITASSIFCDQEEIEKTCVKYKNYPVDPDSMPPILSPINWNQFYFFEKFSFKVTGEEHDSCVIDTPSFAGEAIALKIVDGQQLEISFAESMACIDYVISTQSDSVTVKYYQLKLQPTAADPLNVIEVELAYSDTYMSYELDGTQGYEDGLNLVDKMVIIPNGCDTKKVDAKTCDYEITEEGYQLEVLLDTLAQKGHLTWSNFDIYKKEKDTYDGVFLNTVLYNTTLGDEDRVTYNLDLMSEGTLTFTISDNFEYSCTFNLSAEGGVDWNQIKSFKDFDIDPANFGTTNGHFTITAVMEDGSEITINGFTECVNIANCIRKCETLVYRVCMLSGADYAFNQTIPSSSEQDDEVNSMVDAIEKTFQPIWRPHTKYAIAIKTNESVYGGGSANHRNTFYYGFQTKGPIGYYHNYFDDNDNDVTLLEYAELVAENQEDSFKLSKLQHYVDYARSYPNADGDLLSAKPLFYQDPKLLMFYKKQYMYSMFGNWDGYLGNNPVESALDVKIQDAIEPQVAPESTLAWKKDIYAMKEDDVLMLNNMIVNAPAGGCPPDEPLEPSGTNAEIEIDFLEPLKLYTAIFRNKYRKDADATSPSPLKEREVHRYPFRTSRYPTFVEQVNSYILKKDEGGEILKSAVFTIESSADDQDVSLANAILNGSADLKLDHAEMYDRITQGALKIGVIQPSVCTEFNYIKHSSEDKILGILVRNPEPFNDPKTPDSVLDTTIECTIGGGSPSDFLVIHSKDRREAFITNADFSFEMISDTYDINFRFMLWNGHAYDEVSQESVSLELS